MKRVMTCIVAVVVSVGVVVAGGDGARDAQMAGCPPPKIITKVVKADCPDCDKCEPTVVTVEKEVIKEVPVVREKIQYVPVESIPVARGQWYAAASALYPRAVGAGVGYKFPKGIMVVGQVTYGDPVRAEATAVATAQAACDNPHGLVSGGRCIPDRQTVTATAWDESSRVGVAATVLFPVGGRGHGRH